MNGSFTGKVEGECKSAKSRVTKKVKSECTYETENKRKHDRYLKRLFLMYVLM